MIKEIIILFCTGRQGSSNSGEQALCSTCAAVRTTLTNYGIVKTWPGVIVSIALRTEPTAPQGTPAARQERGSLRWLLVQPWVYERDAETGEVLYIARHQRQVVLKRGRRDHAVRNTRRGAPQLAAGHRERPSVRQWLASPERTRSANHSGTVTLMKFPS